MKKIVNAIIKKMIHEERILMVIEDSDEMARKLLKVHPNYIE